MNIWIDKKSGKASLLSIYSLIILFCLIVFTITRIGLLIFSSKDIEASHLPGIFGIGLMYDIIIISFLMIPFLLQTLFINEFIYQLFPKWTLIILGLLILAYVQFSGLIHESMPGFVKPVIMGLLLYRYIVFVFLSFCTNSFRQKWRSGVLKFGFFIFSFFILFNAVSEFFFWDEFTTRYNFIAVDYLVYTTEVLGNIWESYPVIWIVVAVVIINIFLFIKSSPVIKYGIDNLLTFRKRSLIALLAIPIPLLSLWFINISWQQFSTNPISNELSANGLYNFVAAFKNNELDFEKFYATIDEEEAYSIVKKSLVEPYATFLYPDDPGRIERRIYYGEPQKNYNVVLISMESFNANYLSYFGNEDNLTPVLDSLIGQSLFFNRFYACGTRTVRGLETLSLGLPPTPGQSVVKRPNQHDLFTLGNVLNEKGYTTQYIYGGSSYFDNMKEYFGNNGYDVLDRKNMEPDEITFENVWGVADENLFAYSLKILDENEKKGKPFFSHIMTVSNHRPFTYPEGKIDIPPTMQSRKGGVKYTDFSIGEFFKEAKKKSWFSNTIFVIVSDHCASSAGKTELPVNKYHIPCWIYAPGIIEPGIYDKLTSQLDLPPTILGILKANYVTKYIGKDILNTANPNERIFISTYQSLGYIKDSSMIVLAPNQKVSTFKTDFSTGASTPASANDSLMKEAIAFYQCAANLLKTKKYMAK